MPSSAHLEDVKINTRTLEVLKSFFAGNLLGGSVMYSILWGTYLHYKVKERKPAWRVGKIELQSQHGFLRSPSCG
jgi:hypothetical protein